MGLDFSILDDHERPLKTIPLRVDEHWRLFGNLDATQFPFLSRLGDYYSDAQFSPGDLDAVSEEIERRLLETSPVDRPLLKSISELISHAKELGEAVDVQAD